MGFSRATDGIVQVWINVADADGRSHLESRWVTLDLAAELHATHAA